MTMTEPIFDPDRLDVYRLSIEYVASSFAIANPFEYEYYCAESTPKWCKPCDDDGAVVVAAHKW